jgi:hypothetical protein
VNLSRTRAKQDVELCRMVDVTVDWDGQVGGLGGDRGTLQLLGAVVAAGEATREHLDRARVVLHEMPTSARRGTLTSLVEYDDGTTSWRSDVRSKVIDGYFAAVAAKYAPGETRQLTGEMLALLNHDTPERDDPDGESRRRLRWTRVNGMHRLIVDLDAKSKAIVNQAIAAASAPSPADEFGAVDDRSQGQREADALVDLVAAGAGAEPSTRVDATLIVHATPEQLRGEADAGAAVVDGQGAVSQDTLDYLGCDANVRTVILNGDGVPVAMTSKDRCATPRQRIALTARDRGCVAPGCGAPSWVCHAHHVQFWRDGGPTEVTNLVLLCPRHHRQLHSGQLEVRFAEDGRPQSRWTRSWTPGPWRRNDFPEAAHEARRLAGVLR